VDRAGENRRKRKREKEIKGGGRNREKYDNARN
jgi:hypothetical protein